MGIRVVVVEPASAGALAGVREDDLVTFINGEPAGGSSSGSRKTTSR
jgi:S1-C subfamily serine protease